MNLNGLVSDFENFLSYDEKIPFHYRALAKLLSDGEFDKAKKLIQLNSDEFSDEYSYMALDIAVESCLNVTIKNFDDSRGCKVFKPCPEVVDFIRFLLENGANPHLPEEFNQLEHLDDLEFDSNNQCGNTFDCSEVRELLKQYM